MQRARGVHPPSAARATHASAFEVVLFDTFEAAPTVARKLGEILRGETYLDRAFVATIADGVGEPGEEIEPYELVRSLMEPARERVEVGRDRYVTVVVGFSTVSKHADAASPLLVYTKGRLVERHDDWRLALNLRQHLKRDFRKEYALGLTVVIIDEAMPRKITKQRIVRRVLGVRGGLRGGLLVGQAANPEARLGPRHAGENAAWRPR